MKQIHSSLIFNFQRFVLFWWGFCGFVCLFSVWLFCCFGFCFVCFFEREHSAITTGFSKTHYFYNSKGIWKRGLIFQKLTNPKKTTKHPNIVLSAVTILFYLWFTHSQSYPNQTSTSLFYCKCFKINLLS